eukprot:m.251441 g.251441  ORF g.251441 m.251441 type:complete len:51 (+) comp26506_c1_seq1:2807-2959(+)
MPLAPVVEYISIQDYLEFRMPLLRRHQQLALCLVAAKFVAALGGANGGGP